MLVVKYIRYNDFGVNMNIDAYLYRFNDTAIFKSKVYRNDAELLIKWLGFLNNGSVQEQVHR